VARGSGMPTRSGAPTTDTITGISTEKQVWLEALQGFWEDGEGRRLEVEGAMVIYRDASGTWPILEHDGTLMHDGAALAALSQGRPSMGATWVRADGSELVWRRMNGAYHKDEAWAKVFRAYKTQLLRIRRSLWAAVTAGDQEKASALQGEWESGGAFPLFASMEQQYRLAAGRQIAEGICFRHRKSGLSGVVLACRAWRGAPEPRVRGKPSSEGARELAPYYLCAMEFDKADAAPTLVAEVDIEVSEEAFPVRNPGLKAKLIRCDEIRGYLPHPSLGGQPEPAAVA